MSRNATKRKNVAESRAKKNEKNRKEELSTTQRLRNEVITKQYANRGLYQEYSRQYMEKYVNRNINSAIGKLKRAENKGYYMSSDLMKEAKSKLRQLYRKMGLEDNIYHKSETFRSSLTSNADYAVLFRAIHNIMDVDVRQLAKEHRELDARLDAIGIKMSDNFKMLSFLSTEFREVYAFLSYNQLSTIVEKGGGLSQVFNKFVKEAESKILSPDEYNKRIDDIRKLYSKAENALNSRDWKALKTRIDKMQAEKERIKWGGKKKLYTDYNVIRYRNNKLYNLQDKRKQRRHYNYSC